MGNDRYDAIVVGAGPAGSATALTMAKNNMSVLLVERGEYPGAKNVFGGTIYRQPTEVLVPAFWEEAPLERPIVSDELWLLDSDSAVKMGFTGLKFSKPPYNKFTALRSYFDRWFARKAQEAGAGLVVNTLVSNVIFEKIGISGKRAVGVELESGDRIYCDIVIIAEGMYGNLVGKAGLKKKVTPDELTVYVKEVLEMPAEKIEDRFNLEPGEGASIAMVGYPTSGAIGKAGIFTNKNSLSIIVGAYLDQIISKGLNPYMLLARLKDHPLVKRLIEGSKLVEFQSFSLAKGGFPQMPPFSIPGLMIVGDAALMISGRRGADLAMLSGKFAGEAAAQAKSAQDFSEKALKAYQLKLNNSFFMKDIKVGQGSKHYYKQHPDADFLLSKIANETAYEYFTVDLLEASKKRKSIMEEIVELQSIPKTLEDLYQGFLHWGVY
jgi:electron transfer flavoprotein-quinone oxidoreductase